MEKEILVSVICTTYNHEKYIEKALKGFVIQKTLFDYEILIHEDASTDKTAEIIKKYEALYPDLIKVIYQKENQFSQGKSPSVNLYNIAKGKYLAFCEGDDYWIDENKLQKQVDFLENNKTFSAIYSNVLIVDENNKISRDEKARQDFPLYDDFIEKKCKGHQRAALGQISGMLCINFWKLFSESSKEEFFNCKVNGDVKIHSLLNQLGDIYFSRDITSCYRRTYIGDSWNARTRNKDISEYQYNSNFELYKFLDKVFDFKIDLNKLLLGDLTSYFFRFLKKPNMRNLKIFYKLYRKGYVNIMNFFCFFIKRAIKVTLKKLKLIKITEERPLYIGRINLKGKKNL